MRRVLLWLLLSLPLLAQACPQWIDGIEAAYELHDDGRPPVDGWEVVTLPDIWSQRWPQFSGAVWYRVRLHDACLGNGPVALAAERINMAGMLYVNADLLWRDASLLEPLSRSWNMPRYWLLPASAMRESGNTLWFRVSGMAYSMPGLGRLEVGEPERIWPLHQQQRWQQRTLLSINLIVSMMMGTLFLIFWALRRQEAAFGWFALSAWAWAFFVSNALVTSPWPFSSSETWQRLNVGALVLYFCSSCMFIWRFGGQRFVRLERWLWGLTLPVLLLIGWVPQASMAPVLAAVGLGYALLFIINCIQFQFHAWRHPQRYNLLLALCLLVFVGIVLYGMLVMIGAIPGRDSYVALTSLITPLVMFLIVAWRFTGSLRRIERFNEELQEVVERTRSELTDTLQREHRLEEANIRLNERLHIAHDLHDSLGSSLVRSIAMVERSDKPSERMQFLSILRMLRDDLRQVIDSSSASATVSATPTQWLAPLRHRFVGLFDELGLASHWDLPERWPCRLSSMQQLALTRFVEEALTNVIKHSRARSLEVRMCTLAGRDGLSLCVTDNGRGFDVASILGAGTGIGMQSMHMRIARIGGVLTIDSRPGETCLTVELPGA